MEGDGSLEGRLRYLEQGSQQLKQQMQVMKSLVTTEVDELKGVMRQQVEDMKQIIVHQDRLYQERIRRLEARVEQLAEFSMHLAQSKGMIGTMGKDTPGGVPAVPSVQVESPPKGHANPSAQGVSRILDVDSSGILGAVHDSDDEEHASDGFNHVLVKYSEKINQVYRHYTETASRALHPVMNLQQFSKLTKDCGLCNSSQGGTVAVNAYLPPPELLWMNVMRRLPKQQKKKGQRAGNFAFERVQEIHLDQFPDVLVILAEEQYGRDRPDMDKAQVVELFLVNDIFPVTDQKITQAGRQKTLQKERRQAQRSATSINDYYDNEDIRECLREYKTKLTNTYQVYVAKGHSIYRKTGTQQLSLEGFSMIIKDHGLLPLISKSDVREIFFSVMHSVGVLGSAGQTPDLSNTDGYEMDKKAFIMALKHVAEHIYGERALAEKYQTPDARFRKLLSKMYLLSS